MRIAKAHTKSRYQSQSVSAAMSGSPVSAVLIASLCLCLCWPNLATAALCPKSPVGARVRCLCNKGLAIGIPQLLHDKYLADVEAACQGAVLCSSTGNKYKNCTNGKLFNETKQLCMMPSRVDCGASLLARQKPASPSPGPASSYCITGKVSTGDGGCGAYRPGGYCCAQGLCCSMYGICGWTQDHCDVNNGCQVGYGNCTGQLTRPDCVYSNEGICGPASGGKRNCCGFNWCCSAASICGDSDAHCDITKGCQPEYGRCDGMPSNSTVSPSPRPAVRQSPSPAPPLSMASPSPRPTSPSPRPRSPSPAPSTKASPSPAPTSVSPGPRPLLPTGAIIVGYYESWSDPGVTSNLDLGRIPDYVNVVMLSFAMPDCTYTKGSLSDLVNQTMWSSITGLLFNSQGPVIKAAIATLKSTRPNTRVLLSVGGSGYTNFARLNVKCLQDLVEDLNLDGVDLDYEVPTSCTQTAGRIQCTTDAETVAVTTALRTAFPPGRYILSAATGQTGMYGEGEFVNALPTWSESKGSNLAMAKSAAGQAMDLVSIMCYLIGDVTTSGYDWREAYRAHKAIWRTQAVAIGMMVPPEEWGNHVLTIPEVTERATYAADYAAGTQYGIMLWSLQLSTGCPNPQQILQTACEAYSMGGCDAALPFTSQRRCDNSSTGGPEPGCPGGYSVEPPDCGYFKGFGRCCREGCCSMYGFCGTGIDYCDINRGCQPLYGTCTGGPAEPPGCQFNPNGRCGPDWGGYCCANGNCCSAGGWCGNGNDWCGNGCQRGYGRCN